MVISAGSQRSPQPAALTDLNNKLSDHVASRLNELLDERGWDLEELERRSGIQKQSLRLWTAGAHPPKLAALVHLTRVFELSSMEELIGGPLGTTQLLGPAARE